MKHIIFLQILLNKKLLKTYQNKLQKFLSLITTININKIIFLLILIYQKNSKNLQDF